MLGDKTGALEDAVLVTNCNDADHGNESKVVRAMILQAQVIGVDVGIHCEMHHPEKYLIV